MRLTQTVYDFVDYNLGVEISAKKGLTEKERGSFGNCSAWDLPRQRTYLEEESICLGYKG